MFVNCMAYHGIPCYLNKQPCVTMFFQSFIDLIGDPLDMISPRSDHAVLSLYDLTRPTLDIFILIG